MIQHFIHTCVRVFVCVYLHMYATYVYVCYMHVCQYVGVVAHW